MTMDKICVLILSYVLNKKILKLLHFLLYFYKNILYKYNVNG